jgi:hypothetical protein
MDPPIPASDSAMVQSAEKVCTYSSVVIAGSISGDYSSIPQVFEFIITPIYLFFPRRTLFHALLL